MSRSCRFLVLIGFLVLAGASGSPVLGGADRPNVVLITIDTLRADHISAYGYDRQTSPQMDRLIERGIRFDDARPVEPLTSPALCSMVTSLYPNEHGSTRNGLRMREYYVVPEDKCLWCNLYVSTRKSVATEFDVLKIGSSLPCAHQALLLWSKKIIVKVLLFIVCKS